MSDIPRIYYGVPMERFSTQEWQDTLEKCGIKDLDTGAIYPGSEAGIGANGASQKFNIHTKTRGFQDGSQSYAGVVDACHESLRRLGVKQVETYYLHSPDPATPISETLRAIQDLYLEGAFKHFGLSNFLAHQVQEVHSLCTANNYIIPSIYEGHYNPVGRHSELELIPVLRKLNIRFNAYGALAGGFLTKSPSFFTSPSLTSHPRWNPSTFVGGIYHSMYVRPKMLEGLQMWNKIAEEMGVSKAALSYRWLAFHSHVRSEKGDGIVVGALKKEDLEQVMEWLCEGELSEEVVRRIEDVWKVVESEAPIDNFHK